LRTRIAFVAAIAAFVVFSAAGGAALALTVWSSKAGAEHPGYRQRKATPLSHRLAERQTPLTSVAVLRSIELEVAWQRAVRPAPPKPPPPPSVAAPAAPVRQAVSSGASLDSTTTTTPDWACIRDHESGDNYSENTGNGYSGAYQFLPSTWNEAVSGAGYPQFANGEAYEAPPSVQNAAALWLYNLDGWSPWSTRYVCGL
jgi:hypothetical protein